MPYYRAGLGSGCEEQYPPSITMAQTMECAFLPWSATCMALKRRGQAECEAMAAVPKPVPVAPPPINDAGYIKGDPATVIDEQIRGANQGTLDRLRDFFTQQADEQPVESASALPLVALGIAAVAAFSLVKGR